MPRSASTTQTRTAKSYVTVRGGTQTRKSYLSGVESRIASGEVRLMGGSRAPKPQIIRRDSPEGILRLQSILDSKTASKRDKRDAEQLLIIIARDKLPQLASKVEQGNELTPQELQVLEALSRTGIGSQGASNIKNEIQRQRIEKERVRLEKEKITAEERRYQVREAEQRVSLQVRQAPERLQTDIPKTEQQVKLEARIQRAKELKERIQKTRDLPRTIANRLLAGSTFGTEGIERGIELQEERIGKFQTTVKRPKGEADYELSVKGAPTQRFKTKAEAEEFGKSLIKGGTPKEDIGITNLRYQKTQVGSVEYAKQYVPGLSSSNFISRAGAGFASGITRAYVFDVGVAGFSAVDKAQLAGRSAVNIQLRKIRGTETLKGGVGQELKAAVPRAATALKEAGGRIVTGKDPETLGLIAAIPVGKIIQTKAIRIAAKSSKAYVPTETTPKGTFIKAPGGKIEVQFGALERGNLKTLITRTGPLPKGPIKSFQIQPTSTTYRALTQLGLPKGTKFAIVETKYTTPRFISATPSRQVYSSLKSGKGFQVKAQPGTAGPQRIGLESRGLYYSVPSKTGVPQAYVGFAGAAKASSGSIPQFKLLFFPKRSLIVTKGPVKIPPGTVISAAGKKPLVASQFYLQQKGLTLAPENVAGLSTELQVVAPQVSTFIKPVGTPKFTLINVGPQITSAKVPGFIKAPTNLLLARDVPFTIFPSKVIPTTAASIPVTQQLAGTSKLGPSPMFETIPTSPIVSGSGLISALRVSSPVVSSIPQSSPISSIPKSSQVSSPIDISLPEPSKTSGGSSTTTSSFYFSSPISSPISSSITSSTIVSSPSITSSYFSGGGFIPSIPGAIEAPRKRKKRPSRRVRKFGFLPTLFGLEIGAIEYAPPQELVMTKFTGLEARGRPISKIIQYEKIFGKQKQKGLIL